MHGINYSMEDIDGLFDILKHGTNTPTQIRNRISEITKRDYNKNIVWVDVTGDGSLGDVKCTEVLDCRIFVHYNERLETTIVTLTFMDSVKSLLELNNYQIYCDELMLPEFDNEFTHILNEFVKA